MQRRRERVSVFAGLLPGLRDIRAPLASGAIVLFAVAPAIEPRFPPQQDASGIPASLIALAEEVGPAGKAAAAAFSAYLLGSIIQGLPRAVGAFARGASDLAGELEIRDTTHAELAAYVQHIVDEKISHPELRKLFAGPPDEAEFDRLLSNTELLGASWAQYAREYRGDDDEIFGRSEWDRGLAPYAVHLVADRAIGELPLVKRRLIGKEPELFSEVDRLESEAELRSAISIPLLLLAIVLAVRVDEMLGSSLVILSFVLAVGILLAQGVRLRAEAQDALIGAILVERVSSGPLDQLLAEIATVHGMLGASQSRG